MFQRKEYEIFLELPNIFGIADVILIICYNNNGADHDRTLSKVLPICRKEHQNPY